MVLTMHGTQFLQVTTVRYTCVAVTVYEVGSVIMSILQMGHRLSHLPISYGVVEP